MVRVEEISSIALANGVETAIRLVRESLLSEESETQDPLAGEERDGVLALALIGAKELARRD